MGSSYSESGEHDPYGDRDPLSGLPKWVRGMARSEALYEEARWRKQHRQQLIQ